MHIDYQWAYNSLTELWTNGQNVARHAQILLLKSVPLPPSVQFCWIASSFDKCAMDLRSMEVNEENVPSELMGVFSYLCQPQQAPPSAPTWEPHNKRRRHQDGRDSNPDSDLRSLCQQMGRLLLRQEDVLNSLCQDHSYICFMSRMTHGVLPQILEKTKQWHQAHKQNEATLTLRASLCHVLFEQMRQRLNDVLSAKKGEAVWKGAIQSHLITEDMMIPDLQWDHKQKKLIPKLNSGRPYTEILQMLDQLQQLCIKEGVIQKLHALQNTNSQTSHVLPWRLQVSLRHGLSMLQILDQLQSSAIWQYIQCRMRPWSQQRSTLAQSIQKSLPRASTGRASWRQSSSSDAWMKETNAGWMPTSWPGYGVCAKPKTLTGVWHRGKWSQCLTDPKLGRGHQSTGLGVQSTQLGCTIPTGQCWVYCRRPQSLWTTQSGHELGKTHHGEGNGGSACFPQTWGKSHQSAAAHWLLSADENAVAGFLYDSVYKVFQLDRVSYDSQGKPQKLKTSLHVEPQVHLPCFVDATNTTYQILSYDVVAVVYHSGTANGGHLQAGLRAGPPTQWHCTDDGRVATYHPTLLREVAKDLVQIWLVKSTSLGCAIPRPPNNGFTTMVQQIALKMQDKAYADIYKNEVLREQLATRCVLCGQWVFRYRDAIHHLMEHHSQAEVKWTLYRRLHDAIPCSPCRWCSAWNVERHNCLPLLQAVLTLHLNMTEEPYTVPLRTPKRRKSADSATPAAPSLAQHLGMTMHMEFSESGSLAAPPKDPPSACAAGVAAESRCLDPGAAAADPGELPLQESEDSNRGAPPLMLTWRPPWRVRLLLTWRHFLEPHPSWIGCVTATTDMPFSCKLLVAWLCGCRGWVAL